MTPQIYHILERLGLQPDELRGCTSVVTGAGRGIGREIAVALAALGARVVIAEIAESGKETEEIVRSYAGEVLFVQTDVSNPDSVTALAKAANAAFGPVDIVVNNAIVCPVGSILELDPSTWDKVMAVNLRGTFLVSRAFLPDMLAKRQGTIVNLISGEAMPGLSAYIVSKQGMLAFTHALDTEFGDQGVTAVALAIGMVDTPGIRAVAGDLAPRLGLTEEQFFNVSLHTGYEGLMPAADAGAAAAYLIARLAGDYNGDQVTGYTILERAGWIAVPGGGTALEPEAAAPPDETPADGLVQIRALVPRLIDVVRETEAEFNRLPVFVRPMARRGFRNKTGKSLQEWNQTLQALSAQVDSALSGETAARENLCREFPSLAESLNRLFVYYEEVPSETARMTKDVEFFKEVARISEQRMTLIRALIDALESVVRG